VLARHCRGCTIFPAFGHFTIAFFPGARQSEQDEPGTAREASMHYLRAYRFMFDSPNWLANVGFVTLCVVVIPVIGPMVAWGYLFAVVEAMHRQGHDRGYPDFTWDQFVPYLVRGAQAFLVQFLATLPVQVLISGGVVVGFIAVVASSAPAPPDPLLLLAVIGGVVIMSLLVGLVLNTLTTPLLLRVGLSQDLKATLSWTFFTDFLRRMWWPTLKAEVFLMLSGLAVMVAGLAVVIVGFYLVAALPTIARYHVYYQLYEEYLARGGSPIPLKEEPPPLVYHWEPEEKLPGGTDERIMPH
jgi:hypothetical protein